MSPAINASQLSWLLAALGLVAAPHLLRLPGIISGIFVLCLLWRWQRAVKHRAQSKHFGAQLLKQAMTVGCVLLVVLHYGDLLGRDPGVALLLLLLGLKVLELNTRRDYCVTSLLGFFVMITSFFFSQSLWSAAYLLASVAALVAALIRINDNDGLTPSGRLRLSGALVAQAVPLGALAFILFPRLAGPLWGLPADAHGGLSGLSDEMRPGSISTLSVSDAVAFRVRFEGEPPPAKQRYWRGPVLWWTDGVSWQGRESENYPLVPVYVSGRAYNYEVTLEPHNRRWMFGLEMPAQSPAKGKLTHDFQILARRPIHTRMRYRLRSHTEYRLAESTIAELEMALQLPAAAHPRTRALAERWRTEESDSAALVQRALTRFNEQSYYYTLEPGAPEGDYIDYFLFDSRRGFCEHYAAAFAVLMRAAGVPARIVTGYQGGELNTIGDDYLIVRQRDAHAWVEVWLPERGWTRVDPTAAVSPLRIEQGAESVIEPLVDAGSLRLGDNRALRQVWRRIRHGWDAVNNAWNQWVLGYSTQQQTRLMRKLGMRRVTPGRLTLALTGAVVAAAAALAILLGVRQRQARDPALAAYQRFCKRLRRVGLRRAGSEGPADFGRRVAARLPERRDEVAAITDLYIRVRYASDPARLAELVARVRQFSPA